jgi:alpha-1,2-mannosyltransferase
VSSARTELRRNARRAGSGAPRPAAEWLLLIACAAAACALRAYQLSRPGYLFGVTEYDDGVLFGNALRLVNGVMPYRDFSMVQPPGSTLLIAPAALLGRAAGTSAGLAASRLLTVAVDTANVVLLGVLVRHRGRVAVLIACGGYAVYPDAIIAAHTFLLEPWLNLLCLLGAVAVFDGDRVTTSRRRLAWAGAAFGFAVAVKLWALVPLVIAIVAVTVIARRVRPAAALAGGAALGLGLPLLPFVVLAPAALIRGVLIGQAVRDASTLANPVARLADLAGARLLPPGVPQRAVVLAAIIVLAACWAGAWLAGRRLPSDRELPAEAPLPSGGSTPRGSAPSGEPAPSGDVPLPAPGRPSTRRPGAGPPWALDCYSLACTVAVTVMFLLPQLYYPHYGSFLAPFLVLALALPAGRMAGLTAGQLAVVGRAPRWRLVGSVALASALSLVLAALLVTRFHAESTEYGTSVPAAADKLIPAGACVITNQAAYTVAADRFDSGVPGCPGLVDSFGTLIAMTSGRPDGPPSVVHPVVKLWEADMARAQYVWLTENTGGQMPWTSQLYTYFTGHFRLIGLAPSHWTVSGVPSPGIYAHR